MTLDFDRMYLPMVVEAHGTQWLAVYHVATSDTHHMYLAVPAAAMGATPESLPQPCSLIGVPFPEHTPEDDVQKEEEGD